MLYGFPNISNSALFCGLSGSVVPGECMDNGRCRVVAAFLFEFFFGGGSGVLAMRNL